jgi:uncharacterized protein YndB with AHSA1/START domain
MELRFETDIRASPEAVFDIITDFHGQTRWLSKSLAFRGTDQVSSNPVTLGTTYREPGWLGVRHGTVTEFDRPSSVTFSQPMTVRASLGIIDATVRYELQPRDGSTRVNEIVTAEMTGPMKAGQLFLKPFFLLERNRTLRSLKTFAEQPS